jgi:surfactin synthase thioesterase subunit
MPGPRWFSPAEPSPQARVRVFMFPHAGSGALAYRDWHKLLPPQVGVQALTLPGRHGRRTERLPYDWDTVLSDLHQALLDALDDERPYALFGHCIGAQLAYRLSVRLEAAGDPVPSLIGISGWAPRGFFRPPAESGDLSMTEVGTWVKDLGAFPDEVWADPDMLDLVLPPIVADYRVSAQYRDDEAVVSCPLVSYSGQSDPLLVEPDAMACWAGRSRQYQGHVDYPGEHFYITAHAPAVAADFVRRLLRITGGG